MIEEILEGDIYTLTDDEEGTSQEYEVLGTYKEEDREYIALIPYDEEAEEIDEYVILRCDKDENGEPLFATIDDDEEFDRIADYFEDALFSEIDCDAVAEENN